MEPKRSITRADILPIERYVSERRQLKSHISAIKQKRRVKVGPYATFYFENYETMWHQVHEMLYIERGGEAQIKDELEAYNPLIPQGDELVATVMFEIRTQAGASASCRASAGSSIASISRSTAIAPAASPTRRARTPRPRARPRRCSSSAFPSARRRRPGSARRAARDLRHRPSELRPHGGDARRGPRHARRGFGLSPIVFFKKKKKKKNP